MADSIGAKQTPLAALDLVLGYLLILAAWLAAFSGWVPKRVATVQTVKSSHRLRRDFAHCDDAAARLSCPRTQARVPETVEGIRWVEFDDNHVYVGFGSELPDDWRGVVNAAAFNGTKVLDFGVNVWAVQRVQPDWRPGGKGFLCEATARYGRIEDEC